MFENFINAVANELTNSSNVQEFVPKVRNHMVEALSNNQFKIECIDRVLSTIEKQSSKEDWICPPIYYNSNQNIAIRLICWPAFYSNNPHKHKTWGITGVFFNKLNVSLYNLISENPVQIKKEKNIVACQYEAGYILPNCIHSVHNPSHKTSISIHIFNNLHGITKAEENAIWYSAPKTDNLQAGILTRALIAFSNCLEEIELKNKINLLERIYKLGDIEVKAKIIKSLLKCSPATADQFYYQLKEYMLKELK